MALQAGIYTIKSFRGCPICWLPTAQVNVLWAARHIAMIMSSGMHRLVHRLCTICSNTLFSVVMWPMLLASVSFS